MSTRVIRVHQDLFEYTASGLRTREKIPLETGTHNQVVLVRPERGKAVGTGFGGFAPGSSFPSPVALSMLLVPGYTHAISLLRRDGDRRIYQVFGHARADGDEAGNKDLSDRRADVVLALLQGDVAALQAIAKDDGWELGEQQVMLRVLRCDPGAVDGEAGPVTERAIRWFQADYRDGVFHRHTDLEPLDGSLPVDGKLASQTADALVEALAVACSPFVPPEQLHPTFPAAGCSEYNSLGDERGGLDRRVSLVVHEQLPLHHENAPCVKGDHAACPVDRRDASACLWYREHVVEADLAEQRHIHFDLRWLQLPNGRILLSALTTLVDDDVVEFQVFRTSPIASHDAVADHTLEEALCEPMLGLVRQGVAQVVWEAPEGFDLFGFESWIVPAKSTHPLDAWNEPNRIRGPVFRISGGGATALSPLPGDEIDRFFCTQNTDADGDKPQAMIGVDAFGRMFQATLKDGRVESDRHALDDSIPRVVATRYVDSVHEEEVVS